MKTWARRILIWFSVAMVLLLWLLGWALFRGRFHQAMPATDPDDLWVSKNPDISFVGFDEEKGGPVGQLVHDGEVIDVIMCWGPGPQFDIRRYPIEGPDGILVRGTCEFSQDEGTVQVTEDTGNVLNGAKTLTFVREKRDAENGTSPLAPDFGSPIKTLETPLIGRYTYDGTAYGLSRETFHYRDQEKNTDVEIHYPVVSGADGSEPINAALYEAALHGVESESLDEAYNLTIRGDYSITYLDEAIFSILYQFDVETPGRSGTYFQGVTLDATSGDTVTLADMGIAAKDVFFSRANGRATIVDDIFQDEASMDDLWEAYLDYEQPERQFYLTDGGVGFILYIGGGYTEDVLYEVDCDW